MRINYNYNQGRKFGVVGMFVKYKNHINTTKQYSCLL